MTDLEYLRGRIPGYAGYGDEASRHAVDPQIRAWLGEALAAARDGLRPRGALAERLDGLLLRCEFADLRAVHAAEHARFDPALVARLHELDRAVVEAADRARAAASAEELAAALDDAARLLDERTGTLVEAPAA